MFEHLIDDKLISSTDKIAVGVSGGADSMLLLWALIDKQKKVGFDMVVIHINHHIRQTTSDRDQKFVEDFCKKRKIKQISVEIDVKKYKIQNKITLEESARNLRYEAFDKIMKQEKLNKLFLAHHKNDQVETILMHIFRGSGIAGACGIKQSNKIVRPLLNLTKNEILSLCKDYSINFVEDETNIENDYSRNYIRNVVIPSIEQKYPSAVDSIFNFGKRCEEIQTYIKNNINHNLIIEKEDGIILKDAAFKNENFIIREYIKTAFEKLKIFEDIESKHYQLICNLIDAEVNKQINLPHKMIAKRSYDGIKLFKEIKKNLEKVDYPFAVGQFSFNNIGTIEVKFVSNDEVEYGSGTLYADYNKISNNAVWRFRKQGDVFSKLGTGSKKLNDYFTDKKIDIDKRDNILVLTVENQVLLVAGLDVSEKIKIDSSTDRIVAIKFTSL